MSEIITNKLTGKTAAGNVTVTSGTSTMKLQEGICTGWTNYDAYNSSQHGSFNQSSLTDNGTGDFTMTFTNNSASATDRLVMSLPWNKRLNQASGPERGGNDTSQSHLNNATSTIRMLYFYGASSSNNGAAHDLEGHYFGKISELA